MTAEEVDAVVATLLEIDYRGVLSMEVFEEADFRSSLAVLSAACRRCQIRRQAYRA
jgi:sugar phosphate isomerase/epimerase